MITKVTNTSLYPFPFFFGFANPSMTNTVFGSANAFFQAKFAFFFGLANPYLTWGRHSGGSIQCVLTTCWMGCSSDVVYICNEIASIKVDWCENPTHFCQLITYRYRYIDHIYSKINLIPICSIEQVTLGNRSKKKENPAKSILPLAVLK